MQQDNGQIKTLVENVLAFGDLLLIANKGIGKTNSLMVLAQEFAKLENTKVVIFEDFPKWCLEYSELPYFIVEDEDVRETKHEIDAQDFFLAHSRDYTVRRKEEITKFLEENKHCIFTMKIADIERTAFFIYAIVNYYYRKAYLRKFKDYSKKQRIVFVIEESQNVFDSSTISKKIFNRLRKIFSVSRNLDLHFVLASQVGFSCENRENRLQDLNTKIRGRTRLLIGQVSLDDYELKVSKLLKHSKHKEDVLTLEVGKFLYAVKDEIVSFPRFKAEGKPYLWQDKHETPTQTTPIHYRLIHATPRRKKPFWKRLKEVLFCENSDIYEDREETEFQRDNEDEDQLTEETEDTYEEVL